MSCEVKNCGDRVDFAIVDRHSNPHYFCARHYPEGQTYEQYLGRGPGAYSDKEPSRWEARVKLVDKRAILARMVLKGKFDRDLDDLLSKS